MEELKDKDRINHKTFLVNYAPDKDDLREMNGFLAQLGRHGAMRAVKNEEKLKNYIKDKVRNFKDQEEIDNASIVTLEMPKIVDGKPKMPLPRVIVLTFASGDNLTNEFIEELVKTLESSIGDS